MLLINDICFAPNGYIQAIIFSFRKWILWLTVENHLPEKRKREMCMSALSQMFSLNQMLFPWGGCPWPLSGYRKLGRGSSDISTESRVGGMGRSGLQNR